MKSWRQVFAALWLLLAALPAFAALSAHLDHASVQPGDTVQLMLEKDGQGGGDPDLGPLQKDFDVLGTSTSSSIRIINGSMSSKRQVIVTLSPRRSGSLVVPPLEWDGERTQALALLVGAGSSGGAAQPAPGGAALPGPAPAASRGPVFIESSLEPMQPYVQAATTLTVRLYTAERLYQGSLDLPQPADVLVQQLGKDVQTSRTLGGRQYTVIERRYLLFPQKSGLLQLQGPVLDAQVADRGSSDPFGSLFGGMTSTRPIRVHGDPIAIDVRPRPAAAGQGDWLPAERLDLSESWNPAQGEIHVGDPITRRVVLRAVGLTATQLPDLGARMQPPAGVKVYPDQPALDTAVQGDKVVGTRTQNIAFIADHAGSVTLPAVHLSWWDTAANARRDTELPERVVQVLPAAGGAAAGGVPAAPAAAASVAPAAQAAASPAPLLPAAPGVAAQAGDAVLHGALPSPGPLGAGGAGPWPWLSLGFALAWVATLLAWWRSRRRAGRPAAAVPTVSRPAGSGRAGLEGFRAACAAGDAVAARRELLAWYAARLPAGDRPSLAALGRDSGNPDLVRLLRDLERACYGGGSWDAEALAAAIAGLPAASTRNKPEPGGALPSLYS